jgi:hypothetical protein
LPHKLERQMPLFADEDVALVYGAVRVVDEELRLLREVAPCAPHDVLAATLCVDPAHPYDEARSWLTEAGFRSLTRVPGPTAWLAKDRA